MRRVKIFYDINCTALEESVNTWLSANWSVSIVEILQSENQDGWTITILYLGSDEG